MKVCSICNLEKENNLFMRSVVPVCRKCRNIRRKTYEQEYRKQNKTQILLANKLYKQNCRLNDPTFRLMNNCSRMINFALKGAKYHNSIWKFLPYSIDELKTHLQSKFDSHMNWDNYGSYWHVDHIIPQSFLPYTSMEDENFKKCWSLDNLQPLEAIANIKKSNRLIYEVV